jgi:hypothetical protein
VLANSGLAVAAAAAGAAAIGTAGGRDDKEGQERHAERSSIHHGAYSIPR